MSHALLLSKVTSLIAGQRDQELASVLNDKKVVEKLEMGILHYKLADSGNLARLEQAVQQLNMKFVDTYEISTSMRELVIRPFAEACSLDATVAFQVLDAYFKDNYNRFIYFQQLNQKMNQLQMQMQQQINPAQQQIVGDMNQFQQKDRESVFQTYDNEIRKEAGKIVSAAKGFYLNERRNLLRIQVQLFRMLAQSGQPGQPTPMQQSQNLVREKLIRKDLPINLARGLLRSQDRSEFQGYCDGESSGTVVRQDLAMALQGEKIEYLKLLFSIYASEPELSKNNQLVATTVEYLQRSCQIDHYTEHFQAHDPQYAANQSIVDGLTQITCLAMLQLHISKKVGGGNIQNRRPVIDKQNAHAWNLLLNKDKLSQTTGPVVLCVVAQAMQNGNNDSSVDAMIQELRQNSLLLVTITELIDSEVFRCDELQQMVHAFYLVLYGWLKVAYRFYSDVQMAEEKDQIQTLTLRVLADPAIIRLVWSEAEASSQNWQRKTLNDISDQIEIFKPFLDSPDLNVHRFVQVIVCLSGNKREPRGTQVIEMLQNTKLANQESDLLAELISYLVSQMGPLERQQLDSDEFMMVKAVLILFAKVIKQDPSLYIKLNSAYMHVAELSLEGKLAYIFGGHQGQVMFQAGCNPFLTQLIMALHCLFEVTFEYSRTAVSHLMDAITELYNKDQLVMKQQIIEQLSSFTNQEYGGAFIVSYFRDVVLREEQSLQNYKATQSYLNFLTKIFKRAHPQSCLSDEQRIEFDSSLIVGSLEQIYFFCMEDYFNTSYIDAASMGKYTSMLMKLTRALLSHFMEVPQSMKAPLCEPFPRFDFLFDFISRILNCLQIDQVCSQALELIQVEHVKPDGGLSIRLENKFLSQALKNRHGDARQVSKLINMVQESIRVLNTLLELAMVDDQNNQSDGAPMARNWSSKRCEYIRNLRCVQELRSQVLDPTRVMKPLSQQTSSNFSSSSISISLQSMIAHYILPSSRLGSQLLKTKALDHLTLTCKLWQNNLADSVRPDLYRLLQGFGPSNQIQQLFCQQFEQCLQGTAATLQQCLAWLDLLILAAETQPRFLEMLLREDFGPQRKQQIANVNDAVLKLIENQKVAQNIKEQEQRLHIKFKLTALLSTMAKKRHCVEFYAAQESRFLVSLGQNVIEEECFKKHLKERFNLNGHFLEPLRELDEDYQSKKIAANAAARRAKNQCLAKVTLCLYLQLLISEYSRNPTQPAVRLQIVKIFTNEQFKMLSITQGQISSEVHSLLNMMRIMNEYLQHQHEDRDRDRQKQSQDRRIALGADILDQTESPLYSSHSKEGAVFLKGSLCIEFFKILDKQRLTGFIVEPGADLVQVLDCQSSAGQLGSKLYVSTKELEYALKSEFYTSPYFVAQVIACCTEFNLALSIMFSDHLILREKQNFMVSIGKISLRDSQMNSKTQSLVPLSFLPLISSDVHQSANSETFTRHSFSLTKTMITQAKSLLSELFNRKRNFEQSEANQQDTAPMPQNHFLSRLDQMLLSNLVFTIGVISSQLSAGKEKIQDDVKRDVQKLVQQDILMRMQTLIDVDACLQDSSMIAQEVSGFIGTDHLDGLFGAAQSSNSIYQSEKNKYEMFIQLVTLCFQLCIKLKESDQESASMMQGDRRDQSQRAQLLDRQWIDDAYVKVLAQVLLGMQRNYCFIRGLKVFVLAVQLIDSRRGGFSTLMKKQNDQPLKVIIGKLLEKDASHDETTTILQLLINYAMSEAGAVHLSKLKVLETLFKANIMQTVNEQDLYYSKQLKNHKGRISMQQVRNPSHVHWCQTLILIRTMNDKLLQSAQAEQSPYFRDLVQQMHLFKQRIPQVLHIGLQMEAEAMQQLDQQSNSRKIISMALLEEIELICAIMQQMFEHGDYWAQLDYSTFCELKDYMLFSVMKLLEHCNTSTIIPASVTEHHLAKVTQSVVKNNQSHLLAGNLASSLNQEISAFQLKADITLQKTFLSTTCALLDILLLSKKLVHQGEFSKVPGSSDLLQTWHDTRASNYGHQINHSQPQLLNHSQQNLIQGMMHQMPQRGASGVFSVKWLSMLSESGQSIVSVAFQFMLSCQKSMRVRYAKMRSQFEQRDVLELYNYMKVMFQQDEWIKEEYSGGFNSLMLADINGLMDVLDLAETSLQVSGQVSAMLLEKVREGTSNDLRFANGQFQTSQATLYQTDEQQVVFMASDLMNYLGDVGKECRDIPAAQSAQRMSNENAMGNEDQRLKQSSKLDENYLDKLHEFVKVVKSEPGVDGQSYYNNGGYSPMLMNTSANRPY